jgi:D-glycero-D-manno-heptose 1,7-bisphosphate phosphatase
MTIALSPPGFVAGPAYRASGGRPVLFLDRDGVINVDHGYVHTPAQTHWIAGIFQLGRLVCDLGLDVVIVTNQAGIARGIYSSDQFETYTRWMHRCLQESGVEVLGTFYCPHHPLAGDGPYTILCGCRKPAPGMLLAARDMFDIELESAFFIGDKASDMQAGARAGLSRLLLFGNDYGDGAIPAGVIRIDGLMQAGQILSRECLG